MENRYLTVKIRNKTETGSPDKPRNKRQKKRQGTRADTLVYASKPGDDKYQNTLELTITADDNRRWKLASGEELTLNLSPFMRKDEDVSAILLDESSGWACKAEKRNLKLIATDGVRNAMKQVLTLKNVVIGRRSGSGRQLRIKAPRGWHVFGPRLVVTDAPEPGHETLNLALDWAHDAAVSVSSTDRTAQTLSFRVDAGKRQIPATSHKSMMTVWFDTSIDDTQPVRSGELATPAEIARFEIRIPDGEDFGNLWQAQPIKNQNPPKKALRAAGEMFLKESKARFEIEKVVASGKPGFANMYVLFEGIPKYNSELHYLPVQKLPRSITKLSAAAPMSGQVAGQEIPGHFAVDVSGKSALVDISWQFADTELIDVGDMIVDHVRKARMKPGPEQDSVPINYFAWSGSAEETERFSRLDDNIKLKVSGKAAPQNHTILLYHSGAAHPFEAYELVFYPVKLEPGTTFESMRGFDPPRKIILTGFDLTGAKLAGADLCDVVLDDVPLLNADLQGARMNGVDLTIVRNKDLGGVLLSRAFLTGAKMADLNLKSIGQKNLVGSDLSSTDLSGADMTGLNLTGSKLNGTILRDAVLSEANLDGLNLTSCILTGTVLKNANMVGADLHGLDLSNFDLRKTNLSSANLNGTILDNARLDSSQLSSIILNKASLKAARLKDAFVDLANLRGADLRHADLTGASLQQSDLSNADLSEAELCGANLSDANLSGANLTKADLSKVKLNNANLSGANLTGAKLSVAELVGTNLKGADLSGADLSGLDMRKAVFNKTKLTGANLTGCNLSGADMTGFDLGRVNLTGVNLSGARLKRANLYETILKGANLRAADMSEVQLSSADLSGLNMKDIKLIGAFVDLAGLTGADLSGADLTGVSMQQAVLKDANFCQANLSKAVLSGSKLTNAVLTGVKLNNATMRDTDLTDANLDLADMTGADIKGATIADKPRLAWKLQNGNSTRTNYSRVDLSHMYLERLDLRGKNLFGSNLSGAGLSGAKMQGVNFIRANLRGATLNKANLRGANMRFANLYKARLNNAVLKSADLQWASMIEADLSGTYLTGADLRWADMSKTSQSWQQNGRYYLASAHCNPTTKWPFDMTSAQRRRFALQFAVEKIDRIESTRRGNPGRYSMCEGSYFNPMYAKAVRVVDSTPGAWMANNSTSQWLNAPGTKSIFNVNFSVADRNLDTVKIWGRWAVDNRGSISVNRTKTNEITNPALYGRWTDFQIGPGRADLFSDRRARGRENHSLQFQVINDGGPGGLRIEIQAVAESQMTLIPQDYLKQIDGASFQRFPTLNDWHVGSIYSEDGKWFWRNKAGRKWSLIPDLKNLRMLTGKDNPYHSNEASRQFGFVLSNRWITGFVFSGETYQLQ